MSQQEARTKDIVSRRQTADFMSKSKGQPPLSQTEHGGGPPFLSLAEGPGGPTPHC